ncbi:MAG: hypothetical protein U5L76_01215 [Patescibacteria group bacterium]|nr:hypothetical protein [Patescibacteria group bacterium]
MKKLKTVLTTFFVFSIFSLMSTQKALADLVPINYGDDTPYGPNVNSNPEPNVNSSPEPKTFIDLIEPQHIIIGGAVLAVVIISFVVLFKMRKK